MSKDHLRQAIVANVVRLLREERERLGISMNVLAQRSGLSQSMVSLVERDLRNPTLDTLLRIAQALEVGMADVISRAEKQAKRSTSR